MLKITLGTEFFDDDKQKFCLMDPVTIKFEHSLLSLSKWESEFEIPFLGLQSKTEEQILNYVKYMLVNEEDAVYLNKMTQDDLIKVTNYIESKQTAMFFSEIGSKKPGRTETITAELIYFWMFSFKIPKECENWHLNRLFALIRVFNMKNSKPEKVSRSELAARNRALNEERKNKLNTSG